GGGQEAHAGGRAGTCRERDRQRWSGDAEVAWVDAARAETANGQRVRPVISDVHHLGCAERADRRRTEVQTGGTQCDGRGGDREAMKTARRDSDRTLQAGDHRHETGARAAAVAQFALRVIAPGLDRAVRNFTARLWERPPAM